MIRLIAEGENIYLEVDDERYAETTATEDLLDFVERDYAPYREAVHTLVMEYPFFGAEDADRAAEVLRGIDPFSHAVVREKLDACPRKIEREDDAVRVLDALEEPLRAQTRMRNIFEVAFDSAEGMTQRERYERLASVYPSLTERAFSMRWARSRDGTLPFDGRMIFDMDALNDLRLLELNLHFRQEKRRVDRCACCWHYFVPKTRSATTYCYRDYCRKRGAQFMRRARWENDPALAVCESMRHLLRERASRYEVKPPAEREHLFPLSLEEYWAWSDAAAEARRQYVDGELSAEEFLRKIDAYHLLESYEVEAPPAPGKSRYRLRVEEDMDFDPHDEYQPMLSLDLSADDPRWELVPFEERRREEQEGQQSLRDKYGEK